MQESSGGQNIFGGDDGMPFEAAGKVTRRRWRRYKKERDSFTPPHCQGAGPLQLTSKVYQDRMDANGGGWKMDVSLLTGCQVLAEMRAKVSSWKEVAFLYSGGKTWYVDQMQIRFVFWRAILDPPKEAA
jgi:hypothetical protein